MASLVASDEFDVVLGSRILGKGALAGGMPLYKYVSNRFLTAVQNLLLGDKLSEYHTGYRAFSREVLETLPLEENCDDFVFDNQMLAQAVAFGFRIGEITCPTKYFPEASSINFRRSVVYGLGVLGTAVSYRLHRWGLRRCPLLEPGGRHLATAPLPGARGDGVLTGHRSHCYRGDVAAVVSRQAPARGDRGDGERCPTTLQS